MLFRLTCLLIVLTCLGAQPSQAGFNFQAAPAPAPQPAPSLNDLAHGPSNLPPPMPFNDLPADSALPLAEVPPVPLQFNDDGMAGGMPGPSSGGAQYNQNYNDSGTYTANRGEDLYSVIQRWSAMSGRDVTYASATQVILTRDFQYTGSLEAAVMALLADNPQAGLTVGGM